MAGYTRQSTFLDGDTITASLFNNEYNQLLNAFGNTSGHKHDGTANEGPVIGLIGDAGVVTPLNKVLIDSTNDHIEFWIEVSSSAVQQLYIADGAIIPVTDNDIDLGTSSLQFKDLYINGTANIDSLVLATGSTVTAVLDEDDLSSDSATSLVTQQSVKAYIDAQVTAQDLDFAGDSGGALSIDLDSESLTIAGGTGLDTVGSGNTVTVNIDATVATLTGSQTLTNKTIDVDNNTVSNIEVDNFKASAIVLESEGIGSNDNDTSLPTSAAVKDYVDTQITAEDLDITTDSGTIAIDLDSETLTVSGGTGLDSSATGNAVTLAIDSTVTTLTGTQTLTNKTLTSATLTSPDVNTPDIDGGTIDGATIATSDVTVGAGKTLDVSAGTLTLADNQISGDKVEGGTIAATTITDLTFGSLNDGTITATAFVDEDNMASNSATLIPTQQSVKAYVDTTVAATNEVVEDTTPQLGGDLASNGNDILFADSDKAIFGAGSDLQIYHDGSNSYVQDAGDGELRLNSDNGVRIRRHDNETLALFSVDGSSSLWYDNAQKLATTSTGIDVTGTVVSDGLTVDGDADINGTLDVGTSTSGVLNLVRPSTNYIRANETSGAIAMGVSETIRLFTGQASGEFLTNERLRIANNGDISFYEDTGTTQALFWDASAESLGIGTTSPSQDLEILNGTTGAGIRLAATNTAYWDIERDSTSGHLTFTDDGAGTVLTVGQDGNVGIGTDSPQTELEISAAQSPFLRLTSEKNGTHDAGDIYGELQFYTQETFGNAPVVAAKIQSLHTRAGTGHDNSDAGLAFFTSTASSNATATERMRIEGNTGNVGIGTDSPSEKLHVTGNLKLESTFPKIQFVDTDNNPDFTIIGGSGRLGFYDETNSTERVRIDSSGNFGIGTDSPNRELHLKAANPRFRIEDSDGGYSEISANGGHLTLQADVGNTQSGSRIVYEIDGSEKMRIDSSGNVGIGTTSPQQLLTIGNHSTVATSGNMGIRTTSSGHAISIVENGTAGAGTDESWQLGVNSSGDLGFFNSSSTTAAVTFLDSNDNVGIGTTSPQAKLESYVSGNFSTTYNDFSGDGLYIQTNGTVADGEYTAGISFSRTAGNNAKVAGIAGVQEGSDADKNGLAFFTHSSTGTTDALQESLRISADGNVGIGTTSPNISGFSKALTIDSSESGIELSASGTVHALIASNAQGANIQGIGSSGIRMFTSASGSTTERMRIDSSGNLLVGATSTLKENVNGLHVDALSNTHALCVRSGGNGYGIAFQNSGGSDVGSITMDATSTTYNTTSDGRLKDVTGEARGLEVINELNPVAYNWKADGKADEGLIAQEVKELVPNAVTGCEEEMYQMDYSKLVVHLVAGMKEQQTQIDALQSEINNLKGE